MINPKEIILGVIAVAASILVFGLWKESIPTVASGNFGSYTVFIPPFIGLVCAASLFSLVVLFVKNNYFVFKIL